MKYFIINDFLSKDECLDLIKDSDKFIYTEAIPNMNSRRSLRSSNIEMINLANKSSSWKNLLNKINSKDFFDYCFEKLNINKKLFFQINYVNKIDKLSKFELKFKKLGNQNLSVMNSFSIFKYLLFRIYLIIKKKIFFLKFIFKQSLPIEFIYDYSQAGNGYSREIHRDSDSRIVVILLYLNELSESARGGELNLYKFIKNKKNKIPSRPNPEDCEIIERIKPYPGKLIIFQNTSESFHSVEEMLNHKGIRHFIYGGFTILAGKNPFLLNSIDKLKTSEDSFI